MTSLDWVSRVAAEYRAGWPLALLFDYDGTLTPIVPHPSLAVLPAATRDALLALADTPRVTVAVLSGRALHDVRERVGIPGAWYAGSAGMQLDLDGEEAVDPAVAVFERAADALVAALAEPVRWFPGAWVERKPGCLSVHFRGLTPLKAACLVAEVRDAVAARAAVGTALRVREVTMALEVTPAVAWTKGDAVDRMLGGRTPGPFALYAGDGANDAEAVDRVNARGGLTVGIGPDAPRDVRVRVATQADFGADLTRLTAALGTEAGP